MAEIALIAGIAGAGISAVSTIIGGAHQAAGLEAQGELAKQGAEFSAKQMEMQAAESRASGQRSALEKRRLTALGLSKLQARAAASGGGATDMGVLKLGEGIAGRGEYEALADLFAGENRARGLESGAAAARYEGDARKISSDFAADATRTGSYLQAGGTILSGTSQFGRDYKYYYG